MVYEIQYEARLRCIGTMPGLTTVNYAGSQKIQAPEDGVEQADLEHFINWNVIRKKIMGVQHLKFTLFTIKEV